MSVKYISFISFACLALWNLFSCSSKSDFPNLSSDDFEHLIAERKVQCVDVRTPAEFADGHIPESININVKDRTFSNKAKDLLDLNRPVAVYCKGGIRSRKAARLLQDKGFVVYNLDKGFLDWMKSGKKVVK